MAKAKTQTPVRGSVSHRPGAIIETVDDEDGFPIVTGSVNYDNELRCGHIENGRVCNRMIAKGDFPGKPIEAKCPRCGTLNIFWDPKNTPV